MYVRVVRFTGVSAERMDAVVARITGAEGPPEGVPTSGVTMMFDAQQGTAVVLQHFDSIEAMDAAARALSAMDASETPGTRASVDTCEVRVEL